MPTIDLCNGITASIEPGPSVPMVVFAGVPGQRASQPMRSDAVMLADLRDEPLLILPADNAGTPHRLTASLVSEIARALVADADLAKQGHFRVSWVAVGSAGGGR